MKRFLCIITAIIVILMLVSSVNAINEPMILLQPQNPVNPANSVVSYRVKASGNNLSCTWYMEYEGSVYNISDTSGGMQPWEPYAGETYGAVQEDANTFVYYFGGIERELDGAEIWCVIEDGHYDVASARAIITVQPAELPPVIESIPAQITAYRGDNAEIRCIALAPAESQLTWTWYETTTGRLPDIIAISPGAEYSDTYTCDTSMIGTRYYVCCVESSYGGLAYSSVVPVTVLDFDPEPIPDPPAIQTTSLPNAVAGERYSIKLLCSDSDAEFALHHNPGKSNDFGKTGLELSPSGEISGIPTEAGVYIFSVCASGEGGEGYMSYTLTVEPALKPEVDNEIPEESDNATPPDAGVGASDANTGADTQPDADDQKDQDNIKTPVYERENNKKDGVTVPLWAALVFAVCAAGASIGIFLIIKNKK